MKLSELGRMLEEAAGVEGRELSLGERQAQLEKYRFRFVNIYQELEMSSRFVDTHRDVSQGGDGVQLHSHTFYEMIYCTGGSTQYLLGTQRYRLRHGDIVLIPPGVSHRPLLAEKMADPYRRCVVWFSQEYVESVRPMWPELLKTSGSGCCARPTPVGREWQSCLRLAAARRPAAHRAGRLSYVPQRWSCW